MSICLTAHVSEGAPKHEGKAWALGVGKGSFHYHRPCASFKLEGLSGPLLVVTLQYPSYVLISPLKRAHLWSPVLDGSTGCFVWGGWLFLLSPFFLVCARVCVRACTHTHLSASGGQRSMSNILLNCSPLCFCEAGFLAEPGAH